MLFIKRRPTEQFIRVFIRVYTSIKPVLFCSTVICDYFTYAKIRFYCLFLWSSHLQSYFRVLSSKDKRLCMHACVRACPCSKRSSKHRAVNILDKSLIDLCVWRTWVHNSEVYVRWLVRLYICGENWMLAISGILLCWNLEFVTRQNVSDVMCLL